MIIAFNNPFPRTELQIVLVSIYLLSSDLNILPKYAALSARFSSTATCKAAIATLHPNGFPPKVEPCSPGLIVIIISLSAKAAETGNTPPDNALPRIKISGFIPSC